MERPSEEQRMTGLDYSAENTPTYSFWRDFMGYFVNNEKDMTASEDKSYTILSTSLVWCVVIITFAITSLALYFSYDLFAPMLKESMSKTPLDKTPFVFVAVIFCAALMFLDSLIKTLKYKSRPQENIISLIIKNIGILMLLWYMLNK